EDSVDFGQRGRRAVAGGGGEVAVWHSGLLVVVAVDGAAGACDGRDQRVAHVVAQSAHGGVGRGDVETLRHFAGDVAGGAVEFGGVRRGGPQFVSGGRADRGHGGGSARGVVRAGVFCAGHGEEHVWHGVFFADEHGRGAGGVAEQ